MFSGDDVAVEKMVSTWSLLLSLKKQVSPGGLPSDETGNELQLTSSPQCIVVLNRSDQRILTIEYFIVDKFSSGSVEKVLETIPQKSVHISSLLKNSVNKQHREVNFRRGRCFFPLLSFGWTKLKLLPIHLVAKHRRCFFVGGPGS